MFCVPFPPIFICRIFLCIQKQFHGIQFVFTLLHVLSTPRGPPARKSSHYTYPFAAPSTVDDVVVRLFRFQRSLRITFRESIYFFTGTAFDVVPYEIITYVFNPPVFFGITYGEVCVPDLQYALRRQLRTVRDNSITVSQKDPSVETAQLLIQIEF